MNSMTGYGRASAALGQFTLTGQILEVRSGGAELVIRHDDIPGFMPGMTMPGMTMAAPKKPKAKPVRKPAEDDED